MISLLSSIKNPNDLKSFSLKQLEDLAHEIRLRIVNIMAANGGHLASNLGSVELTIALHQVFNSPSDKFFFDVSHQVYTHKLLTGRNHLFETIRKFKGLSGFAHPAESLHDHFYAGHAGTALSLALGLAKSRDLNNQQEHIIPIIGDASLTCGHTLEALNNVKKELKNFIVILNDNTMSISKNVGNVTNILSRMINNPTANRLYEEMAKLLNKIPAYGNFLAKQGHKVKESIKNLVSPAPFFEEFGLSYVGPIDGHDLKMLIDIFEDSKENNRPALIHVLTEKGHGMSSAANNPITYHGVKPFDPKTGKFLPSKNESPSFPKIFGKHLLHLAKNDPNIIAVTPAMPVGSCIVEFMEKYPERCIDVGIAEGHSVAFSGGLACDRSKKVVCCIYATFLQRALDQVFQEVCLQNAPVIFAIDRSGIAGGDGITHNGIYDIGFLQSMPNMIIVQPRNGTVLKEVLESSFSWNQPVAIRYPNLPTKETEDPLSQRNPGEAEILVKGSQLAIIALGHKCETAMEICYHLQQEGIFPTLVDPVFIKPLDEKTFTRIFDTHEYVVTIEEHSIHVGLGAAINNFIMQKGFKEIKVKNFGILDHFVLHGSHKELTKELELDAENLSRQILFFVSKLRIIQEV